MFNFSDTAKNSSSYQLQDGLHTVQSPLIKKQSLGMS